MTNKKWPWFVFVGVIAGFLLFRGGLFTLLGALSRYLVPLAVIFLAYHFFKAGERRSRINQHFARSKKQDGEIIDICPKCGELMESRHQCNIGKS